VKKKKIEYVSDEEKEPDKIPFLTKEMLESSLQNTRKSVTPSDLEKYMRYKRDMERRLGMDESGAEIVGLEPERRQAASGNSSSSSSSSNSASASSSTSSTVRDFADNENDEDDIYGD